MIARAGPHLTRPLTFVVLAFFVVLFGALAALRTPTDISARNWICIVFAARPRRCSG